MHAALGFQPAIGVRALDLVGAGFDPGFFAGALLEPAHLVAAALGPARVHARQHLRPVLGLGAAGAGVDLDIGVVGVGLARKQRLEPRRLGFGGGLAQRLLALGDGGLVLLGLGHLDQADIVVDRRPQTPDRADRCFEPGALAHHLLGFLGIVPQRRILGARVQFIETDDRAVVVKDAS